jgi:hypothetical protein
MIFGDGAGISTQLLTDGMRHRSAAVRRTVVTLLASRNALTPDLAEPLLADTDAEVRLQAVQALTKEGKSFSNEEAKGMLVKPARGGLGLLSIATTPDTAGEQRLKRYLRQKMLAMPIADLEKATREESIFDRDACVALAERDFRAHGDSLRQSVRDHFRSDFAAALQTLAERFGPESETITKLKGLEEYLTKQFTREGLDLICRKGSADDLSLVREILRSGFVTYTNIDVEYLSKFGEWNDIPLLIASIDRLPSGPLLFDFDETKYRLAARALYRIGRHRLSELLTREMPSEVLSHLIIEVSDTAFRALSDASIIFLLHGNQTNVRKATALKCIRSLPRRRLNDILEAYISGDRARYYNVIHWLDFGVSAPRTLAAKGAEKIIKREWRK